MVFLPSAVNTGSSREAAASGPDARISSWPDSAGRRLPDTGASTKMRSGRRAWVRLASSSVAATPIVPICAQIAPCVIWAMPSPSIMTSVVTSAVGSMVTITSAMRTASATLAEA